MLFCLSTATWANGIRANSETLDNGVKLIVIEDDRAPVVLLNVLYQVGSFAETRPVTGISHVLEHMMFMGTPTYPGDRFDQEMAAMGAIFNAYTSDNFTGYLELAGRQHFDRLLTLEADRARHLSLHAEDFAKEIEVVKEERRLRVDDQPMMAVWEYLDALLMPTGPYHDPLVGWMEDLDGLTIEAVRLWYDTWYQPSQMVVIAIGDLKAQDAIPQMRSHFASLPRQAEPSALPWRTHYTPGTLHFTMARPNAQPTRMMAYPAPSLVKATEPEKIYALLVGLDILDGGKSARFEKSLVREKQQVAMIGTSYSPFDRDDSSLTIYFTPMPDVTLDEAEAQIRAEIQRLITDGIQREELRHAKQRLKARFVYAQDDYFSKARWVSRYEGIGLSYTHLEDYLDAIDAVRLSDVESELAHWLGSGPRAIGDVLPESTKEKDHE